MTKPRKQSSTFVCTYCQRNRSIDLAVMYKPTRGPELRICAYCENIIIGFGESAGIESIRRAAAQRPLIQLRLKGGM